jgi:hypothetical protein
MPGGPVDYLMAKTVFDMAGYGRVDDESDARKVDERLTTFSTIHAARRRLDSELLGRSS